MIKFQAFSYGSRCSDCSQAPRSERSESAVTFIFFPADIADTFGRSSKKLVSVHLEQGGIYQELSNTRGGRGGEKKQLLCLLTK